MRLREARRAELAAFVEMERQADTAGFILPANLAQHQADFDRDDLVYLAIVDRGSLAGFILLALDADRGSVEFRRIVVADKGRGTGQRAIGLLEPWCRERLGRRRIWLDVFAGNARARHVYEKLGYRRFATRAHDRGELYLYDKWLD